AIRMPCSARRRSAVRENIGEVEANDDLELPAAVFLEPPQYLLGLHDELVPAAEVVEAPEPLAPRPRRGVRETSGMCERDALVPQLEPFPQPLEPRGPVRKVVHRHGRGSSEPEAKTEVTRLAD